MRMRKPIIQKRLAQLGDFSTLARQEQFVSETQESQAIYGKNAK
jgi:hypothetical protein